MVARSKLGSRRADQATGLIAAFGMLLGVICITGKAWAAEAQQSVSVELNKLEANGKACRAYIVVTNPSDLAAQVFKLDLIFFRPDAVIERRVAVDLGPVRPAKKSVKTFELDGLPCDGIGRILVNDVVDCRDAAGPLAECLSRIALSSRAGVQLSK